MKKVIKTDLLPNKQFSELSLEQQIKWLEKQTEKVVGRLPSLKKHLTAYDDRSDELYNLEPASVMLMTKSYIADLKSGNAKQFSLNSYVKQLNKYGGKSLLELRELSTQQRIDSFLDNLKEVATQEEYEYAKELIDKMNLRTKEVFVRSKFFFDRGNMNSDDFVKFMNEYGLSVGTANLETFAEQHGIDTQRMYVDETTMYSRGRHREGSRKKTILENKETKG